MTESLINLYRCDETTGRSQVTRHRIVCSSDVTSAPSEDEMKHVKKVLGSWFRTEPSRDVDPWLRTQVRL
ncbi:hypothetical protein F2P81_017662 [Scophthalmus maximus]|uniref:Uncharacterized protein n=1 Tax=Scophthalmus maximus TaxID=52904 RepID=A0A6A4SIH0_SCOMX|nr:hypothetical protein F2P81_017662 [Scophthalmus maximus]